MAAEGVEEGELPEIWGDMGVLWEIWGDVCVHDACGKVVDYERLIHC